jgi:transposase
VRGREDAVHNRRRARQRIKSFLLRYGRVFSAANKKWGAVHRRWLAEQYFDLPAQRITLEEYIGTEGEADRRATRLINADAQPRAGLPLAGCGNVPPRTGSYCASAAAFR